MPAFTIRKSIVSPLGEVTEDTRIAGDRIRLRIHYACTGRSPVTLVITDVLEAGLTDVSVLNGGRYNARTHTATWTVTAAPLTRGGYVELEAVVKKTGVLSNHATATIRGDIAGRSVASNAVTITVAKAPEVGWIQLLPDSREGEAPRVYLKDETTTGTTLRIDIPGMFVYREVVNGVAYQRFVVPGLTPLSIVGKPELPSAGELLQVPFDVGLSAEVVDRKTKTLSGYMVYPVQPPQRDDVAVSNFQIDRATYQAATAYPAAGAEAPPQDVAVVRGHRVAVLRLHPLQYNPVTREVTVATMLEARLAFDHPAQLRRVPRRLESRAFEDLLAASVLNYKDARRFYDADGPDNEPNGCDYLIIAADSLYDPKDTNGGIARLAHWKRRKGYRTRIVKVGAIPGGNTAAAIRAYIQTAYDTWTPVPTYVLLVGDSDTVVSAAGMHHPDESSWTSPQPQVQSDLFYSMTDGTDYFPDIFIGRLSADTKQEVSDIVDKLLAYEQTPPAQAAYYNNAALIGLFTDDNQGFSAIDGQEGRPWIANLESIRDFLIGQGYGVDRIYTSDTTIQTPTNFNDGTALPNDLLSPTYGWTGSHTDISTAWNAGRFLVTYRAHGGWDGWAQPDFGINNVNALTQNGLTPVVFSITCQTGWFDNETDDGTHGGRPAADECFAERLLRRPNAGAAAVLAMSRNSYTGPNDYITFGLFKALWPAFQPSPHWSQAAVSTFTPTVAIPRIGQVMNFGKMYMAKCQSADSKRQLEFEMFHLFGDPEMPVWTAEPATLSVAHPAGIGATGVQDFVVTVANAATAAAVEGAAVVVSRGESILRLAQTDTRGVARFSLDSVGPGDLDVTVTQLGVRPYLGTIKVVSGGAVLDRLEPADGPDGQVIHVGGRGFQAGENVELHFGSFSSITIPADASGQFGEATPTVDLTVQAGCPHGLVNVWARGQTSGRCAVRIFQVRDKNPVDLWIYDQWDSSTWSVHPGDNPTWDNPDIQLYDKNGNPVDSNNLVLGETYTVNATIRNHANFAAPQANVVFRWENYGAGGPWQTFGVQPVTVPASSAGGTAIAKMAYTPTATGHLCMQAEVQHVEDIKSSNNVGQENLHVGYTSSPAKVTFRLWNRTELPAPAHIEVRQLISPKNYPRERIWGTTVKHPEPQILPPGGTGEATVVFDPAPADATLGTKAEFAITVFLAGKMVGGVNAVITRKA